MLENKRLQSAGKTPSQKTIKPMAVFYQWFAQTKPALVDICMWIMVDQQAAQSLFEELTQITFRKAYARKKRLDFKACNQMFFSLLSSERQESIVLKRVALPAEDLFYLVLIFVHKWRIDEVAAAFKVSPSRIRFNSFKGLSSISSGNITVPKVESRECALFDLHWVDGLIKKEQAAQDGFLLDHVSACTRCAHLKTTVDSSLRSLKVMNNQKRRLNGQVARNIDFKFAEPKGQYIPNYLKWPLRGGLAVALLVALLYLPRWSVLQKALSAWGEQTKVSLTESLSSGEKTTFVLDDAKITQLGTNTLSEKNPEILQEASASLSQVKEKDAELKAAAAASVKLLNSESIKVERKTASALLISDRNKFHRWDARWQPIEEYHPKILSLINNLQGKVAGTLELGAQHKGGRYYHFTLSNDNFLIFHRELAKLEIPNMDKQQINSRRTNRTGEQRVVLFVKN